MFDYDGPIYIFLKRVSDVTLLHLIWFFTSIPIVTLGATTTALYGVAVARKAGNTDEVIPLYLEYLKKHWKKGTIFFALLVAALCVLLSNMYYWNYVVKGEFASLMAVLCTALLVPLGLIAMYGFAAITTYESLSVIEIIKKSLFVAYAHPFSSLKLVLFWGLAIWFNLATMYANVLFIMIGFGPFVQVFLARTLQKNLAKKVTIKRVVQV